MAKNMTPEQIKAVLTGKGLSQSGLARDLGCTPTNIFLTIEDPGRSYPTARHIAKALGMQLHEVWPETFEANQLPPRTGRPLTRGLYAPQVA